MNGSSEPFAVSGHGGYNLIMIEQIAHLLQLDGQDELSGNTRSLEQRRDNVVTMSTIRWELAWTSPAATVMLQSFCRNKVD
jgi:hypothetical protein